MSLPELLAPAGSPEGVRAAVQSGANAVYMGFGTFNARRGAQNFSTEEMAEAIAYCRARGVKTNITFNILAADRELTQAMRDARFLYEAGADALIVQDLGLARLLRRHAPDFALHASTQMTIHTLDGARQAKELGFSRVVLSRELPFDEIRRITEQGGVETEIFVHGALCMCYSGQCYLSAVIGQRSGNRGLCAQPCRLPYSGGYPLSLKDLSLADHAAALAESGVSSLKIEGRMKRPEYTAVVTDIYADLLREKRAATAEERETLRLVFSRDGFTDGYFADQKGDAMFGVKTEVPLQTVKPLYDAVRNRFAPGHEAPLVPVSAAFCASADGLTLTVSDRDGNTAVARDTDPVPQAEHRPTDAAMVEKSLQKTGGTPFALAACTVSAPEDKMIAASRLNALRRAALETLLQKRQTPPARIWQTSSAPVTDRPAPFAGTVAVVRTREQAEALAKSGLHAVFAPPEVAAVCGCQIVLPRVFFDREQEKITTLLTQAKAKGSTQALCGNLGHLPLLRRVGLTPIGDFGLNAFNSETLQTLAEEGVSGQVLSFEARLAQLRDLQKPLDTILIVYGYLPLMVFENCAIRRQHGGKCVCKEGTTYLTDRRGQRFALLPEYGCRNTLLNALPLYLEEDAAALGCTQAMLRFTVESPAECAAITKTVLSGGKLAGDFTKGLYHRGVE